MTMGMALDYISEYLDMKDPNKQKERQNKPKIRMATQADFDRF